MKKVTKILSKTKDVLKNVRLHIYDYDEESDIEKFSIFVDSEDDALEAAGKLVESEERDASKDLDNLTVYGYLSKTERWLKVLLMSISETLKHYFKEELADGIHEDMESLWVKIEKLEERTKELELKA
jgi:hypothetical protein